MSNRITPKSLAALLLAGAALAGCGGSADAPPPVGEPPGPGPDTTPPTVSISSNVAAPASSARSVFALFASLLREARPQAAPVTGPVTFTFVFSEDVGVSFEAGDIAVTDGIAGTFTRIDGRQATLVVTPPPNEAGTMTVSVAAGAFTDLANNANTVGASASQDFKAAQTITFASPGNQIIGTPPFALSATASSGLPVTITSTTAPVCTVSGTTLTLVAAGTCSLTATQAGNSTFVAAEPVVRSFSVTGGAPQTITFTSPGDQTIGTPTPALSASASSGLPVSIVSTTASICTVSGTTLTLVSAGDCSLTASQPGDASFAPATPVTQTFKVTGGAVADLVFSSGFAAGNLTVEGGAYFSYSGSNLDGFACNGDPAWCGSGSGGAGATSFYYSYYQTTTPATALYNGISVLAPGVTSISATGDTGGLKVTTQTTVNFTFNNNPEWQASGTNNFGVLLTLGKFYDLDAGAGVTPCNIKLLAVVTPENGGAATLYKVALGSFAVIQSCGTTISTAAAALASSPVSEVAFQAAGGGAALPPVGGKTTGANFTVAAGGFYPTTLALTGGISFEP